DETPEQSSNDDLSKDEVPGGGRETPAQARAVASAASELTDWAKRRRRKATVVVPRVIGMRTAGARGVLEEHGLVPVGWDGDGVAYEKSNWPDRVVTSQSPESGAKVPPGTSVR